MTKEEQMYREERQLRAIVECNLLTTDCKTTATVARRLQMTASVLYQKLKERKILFKSDGMWMLMPKYTGLGLLRYRYIPYYTMLVERKVRVYPVWTEKGLKFLTEEFQDV
jgi:phage antirepressor YoqD-like protein